MLKIIKQLLNGSLFSIIVGFLSQPPCASANLLGPASSAHIACSVVSGRRASMSAITLEGEYIAGSLLMYSRSALTIAGVSGVQPVTGPEALASLNSSQIRANGVNASLHVGLPAGQKCRCSLSGSGVLNCSDFTAPTPPWPAHVGCQWYWAKNGMLMETNASSANYSCLDSTSSVGVGNLDSLWPKNVSLVYNPSANRTMHIERYFPMSQEFNGMRFTKLVLEGFIYDRGPLRISLVRQESITLPSGASTNIMIYRRYPGWSRHCLHECRIVFRPNSTNYLLGEESCKEFALVTNLHARAHLESPFDNPTMAAMATDGCVWTFTLDCTPVLVNTDDRTQLCSPSSRLATNAYYNKDLTEESPKADAVQNDRATRKPPRHPSDRFILQGDGKGKANFGPVIPLHIAAMGLALASKIIKFVM